MTKLIVAFRSFSERA